MHFLKLLNHRNVNQISSKHDGKEYVNKISKEFLNNHNIKRYSRNRVLGAIFAERFNRTKRNLLKKPVFLKGNADWLSELPSVIKK